MFTAYWRYEKKSEWTRKNLNRFLLYNSLQVERHSTIMNKHWISRNNSVQQQEEKNSIRIDNDIFAAYDLCYFGRPQVWVTADKKTASCWVSCGIALWTRCTIVLWKACERSKRRWSWRLGRCSSSFGECNEQELCKTDNPYSWTLLFCSTQISVPTIKVIASNPTCTEREPREAWYLALILIKTKLNKLNLSIRSENMVCSRTQQRMIDFLLSEWIVSLGRWWKKWLRSFELSTMSDRQWSIVDRMRRCLELERAFYWKFTLSKLYRWWMAYQIRLVSWIVQDW